MSEMIFVEADFFAASFAWGILLLAGYDILRIIRRTVPHGTILVAVEDLLFWIAGSLMVFRMIYEKNDGIIRGTAFVAMGVSMFLYHYTVSRYVVAVGYGIFGRPAKKIYTFFYKGLKKVEKKVKLLIKTGDSKKEEAYDKSP